MFRFAGIAVAALAIACLLLLLANQIDQDLEPEARAYYESGRTPELRESSGFAMLIGLSAPVDEDPRRYALAWSTNVARAARERKRYPTPANTLQVRAASEILCQPETFDCVERFRAKPQSIADLAADNAVLLRRYRELQSQSDLADAGVWASYDAPFADYATVLAIHTVFLSQVAALSASAEVDRALRELEADAAFFRRWLSQGRTTISKMVATRGLSRTLLLATQVSRALGHPTPAQQAALLRITAPLTRAEWALANAIRYEASVMPDVMEKARLDRKVRGEFVAQENLFMAHVFGLGMLTNASLNFAYPFYLGWERLDAVPSERLASEGERVRREVRAFMARPDWRWLYNLGGRGVVANSIADFDAYMLRIRDVDAYARLACAAIGTRDLQVAPADVEAHLNGSASACRDPYTGRPFRWDGAARQLWFVPQEPGRRAGERLGGTPERVSVSPW